MKRWRSVSATASSSRVPMNATVEPGSQRDIGSEGLIVRRSPPRERGARNGGGEGMGWPRWGESNARETVFETVLVPNLSGRTSEYVATGPTRSTVHCLQCSGSGDNRG